MRTSGEYDAVVTGVTNYNSTHFRTQHRVISKLFNQTVVCAFKPPRVIHTSTDAQ